MEPRLKGMRAASEASSCADMVRCMYGLTDLEVDVLRSLLRHGAMTSDELARRLRRDRSTVYRSLQRLVSCQTVRKERRALARGGHYHEYSAMPREAIRGRLATCVEEWHARMRALLERFDEDLGAA